MTTQSENGWCSKLGLVSSLAVGGAILASSSDCTLAQSTITPDNTLGAEQSVVIPNFNGFPQEVIIGGARREANLFHSFLEFNVSEGRRAHFFSPDADIQNILARVTGSNRSEILGTIGTLGNSNPNLFLMNPNGIFFGPDASLDVKGSFVATTANAVGLGDAGIFSASEPTTSNLLTVSPSALFLNAVSAQQQIINQSQVRGLNGETNVTGGPIGLEVPAGQTLALVGGKVLLDDGNLTAKGGRVEIGSVKGAGEVGLSQTENGLVLDYDSINSFGEIRLENTAVVDVTAEDGGSIAVTAQNIDVLGGSGLYGGILSNLGSVDTQAGDITLNATEAVTVANGFINNWLYSRASGNAGGVTVDTKRLSVKNGAQVGATTFGEGDAGDLTIRASESIELSGENSGLFANIFGKGNAGDVAINTGLLSVVDGGQISASTFGKGNAGSVNISARDIVSFDGDSFIFNNVLSDAVGNSGGVNITAGSLSVTNGAQIQSGTLGQGDAGNVSVDAGNGAITFDGGNFSSGLNSGITSTVGSGAVGNAGSIDLKAGLLSLTNGAQIQTLVRQASQLSDGTTLPPGQGNSGTVNINAGDITLDGSSFNQIGDELPSGIFSSINDGAVGNGGNINIQANSLNLSNNALIDSTLRLGAEGKGGEINIQTRSLSLTDGAQLNSSTTGKGDAGSVTISARNSVSFSGGSGVLSAVEESGVGSGADITITAPSLELSDGSQLATGTLGQGNSGNIQINATDSVSVSSGSYLEAISTSQGDAGNIVLNAPDAIVSFDGFKVLDNGFFFPSAVSTTTASLPGFVGTGQGGDIAITAKSLSLTNGAQLLTGTIGQAGPEGASTDAGNIRVNASESISLTNGAGLTTSTAGQGDAGGIFVQADDSISLTNSSLIRSTVEAGAVGNAGNIDINAGSLSLTNGAQIQTLVRQAGGPPLPDGSPSLPPGRGNSGTVNINAGDITLDGSSFNQIDEEEFPSGIFSSINDGAVGNGGDINIQANSLSLSNNAVIDSTLRLEAIGKGGDINISNLQSFSGTNGAQLRTDTSGQGNAGDVTIDAPNATISFDGVGTINLVSPTTGEIVPTPSISGIVSAVNALPGFVGDRKGGNVNITARSLSLTNGAQLNSSTTGKGNAGSIQINADEFVELVGMAADPRISGLFSQVGKGGEGNAKDITIETKRLSVRDGAQVNATTSGIGDAGNLTVRASQIELVGSTGITPNGNGYPSALQVRVEPGARGDGGDLTIKANQLSVRDGARVAADTTSRGNAGSLLVQARDLVEVVGTSVAGYPSNLTTAVNEEAVGNGGELTIEKTGQLSVRDGAQVSAAILGQGKGGDIRVRETNSLFLTNGGRITSRSEGQGDAGNISINLRDDLQADDGEISASSEQAGGGIIEITAPNIRLLNSSPITTSVSSGEGGGGNITVNSADTFIAFDDSDILANAEFGDGGKIRINSPRFLAEGFGGATAVGQNPGDFSQFRGNGRVDVSASSRFGTSGTVAVVDSSFLENSLTPLSANFVSPEQVVAGSCLARRNAEQGSFTVTGTGGLPRSPYEAISGQYNVTGVQPIQGREPVSRESAEVENTAWKPGDPIQEAQGMVVTANGRTIIGTTSQLVALAKAQNLICDSAKGRGQ